MTDQLVKMIAGGVARTAIVALAGRGLISASETEQYVSAAVVLAMLGWSIYQKWSTHQKIQGQ